MIHRSTKNNASGFTLVELMLATAFIALLLVAIATVVIQISGIYNKGITMKSVNQAGRAVVDDMKRAVGESGPFNVASASVTQYDTSGAVAEGGRLCTGTYSYVWNIGTAVKTDGERITQVNNYANDTAKTKAVRLVKVRDSGGNYCTQGKDGYPDISATDGPVELLSAADLAVQSFAMTPLTTDTSTGMALYTVTMLISNAESEAIDTSDNSCRPPADNSGYENYCAVNQFDFSVQAGNKGGQ